MSVLPQRQFGLVITLAVAAVGAVVAGVVLFSSSKADEVDLTTASLVPADAAVYVGFNTDLDSSQWVTAFKLIERLGEEDPEGQLRRSAEEDGELDWEDDVVPFLGGNAAFFLRSIDLETFQVSAGVIVRAKDTERVVEVIEDNLGVSLDDRESDGVEYFADDYGTMFVAILGDHVVLTIDEETLLDVIDVYKGDAPSLATVDGFQALRDELSRNFLAFLYVDAESMVSDMFDDPIFETAMREAGVEFALEPMAAVIGANGNGFTFQGASISDPGVVSPLLEPRTPSFASVVPADTSVFVSVTGLGTAIREAMDSARDEIDDAVRESGYGSLDEMLRDAGAALGIDSVEELIDLFSGESALAAWFPTGDSTTVDGVLLTTVSDASAATKTLDSLVPPGSKRQSRTVDGVKVTVVDSGDGDEFAYAVEGSTLLVGTADGVARLLEYSGATLADSETYRGAVTDLPTALGSFAFFDLSSLLRLAEGGVPPELDRVDEALRGAIINMVQERGVVRVSGVVTIAED